MLKENMTNKSKIVYISDDKCNFKTYFYIILREWEKNSHCYDL